MKKAIHSLLALLLIATASITVQAQKDVKNKDLKAIKIARKEAKKSQKEGWYTPPGSVPMEKQFEQAWARELESDEDGNLKNITVTGNATAGTQSAADQAAMTAARNELAAALGAKVSELIETKRANDQIDQATANTLDKTISNSKTLIQAELNNVKTAYKIYKDIDDKVNRRKNVMVQVKLIYNFEEGLKVAQKVIRKELEKESDELGKQLDDILNINPRKRGEELKDK